MLAILGLPYIYLTLPHGITRATTQDWEKRKDMESTRRSIAKALSWRILATVITSVLVFAITGKGEFAATVGLADTTIKFFIYFAHERLWNRVNYGREQKQPEYII
jgi:uncharacterized membrane protein